MYVSNLTLLTKRLTLVQVRDTLITGLADKSPIIQKKLIEFWDHESRLSPDPRLRLRTLLSSMVSTECESSFLAYATNLLLSLALKSAESEEPLFGPLENAVYRVSLSSSRNYDFVLNRYLY